MEIPNIDDSKVRDFSDGAKQELQTQSKIMIEELINEINRVERVRNAGTATEITQSDVLEAVKESSKKIHHHKKKWWEILLLAICPVLSAIPGFIFNKNNLCTIIITIVIFAIVPVITVLLLIKEEYYA